MGCRQRFPLLSHLRDDTFGYILHPVDLATNKVAAAYGRREPRDIADLLAIHQEILPMGAAVWASAGKALGFTPAGIINEIHRAAAVRGLRETPEQAEAFVLRMPTDKVGLLSLQDGHVLPPDPDRLDEYQTTPDTSAANGPPARKSPRRCWSATGRSLKYSANA